MFRRIKIRTSKQRTASRAAWLWAFVVVGLLAPLSARAAGDVDSLEFDSASQLKAEFLCHFAHYVEWPAAAFASSEQPFVIGLLGPPALEQALAEIASGENVGGRPISVRRFATHDQVEPCHLLFVAADTNPLHRTHALDKLFGHPVLIVGDAPGFAGLHGAVNFVTEAARVRFEICPEKAIERQLRISAKLLALARIVEAVEPE